MQNYTLIKRLALIIGAALSTTVLLLLVTGNRVLVSEKRVEPGETYVVPEWGDLGKESHAQLVCRYFTGRSFSTNVLWYSPNNIIGRDQCPFLVSE